MRKSRGVTIGTYITAMAVFAVLTMTLVAMAVQHLFFSSLVQQQQAARNLAEAVLYQALIEVLRSPNQSYGARALASEQVTVAGGVYGNQARGRVTFHPQTAHDQGLPLSINNFSGTGLRTGHGDRQVPANTLHLVARGECGSARKTLEMLYYIPPFPNALASEGPVRSLGGLLVAGVKDPEKFPGNYDQVAPEDRSPSHVMSNFDGPAAVDLGPGANIQGNVGAVGGVKLDPGVIVAGAVRQHMEPQPLPDLDLDAIFSSLNSQYGKDILPSTIPNDYQLSWNAQCDTDLHVRGSLQLNNGVLFVRGNLTVDQGVKGEGAIFVGGETLIRRGSDLLASDQVALVSRRKITLQGNGRNSFYFQGLLYSEEEILANNMTVVGAVIARAALELNEVNLINAPVTVSLIEGLELRNHSDDDTVQIIIRVEERDPESRRPLRYKVQLRGFSDDAPTLLSPPIEQSGLTGYDDIKAFIAQAEGQINGWKKNSYRADWYWNASEEDKSAIFGTNPLRNYLDALEGKNPDPSHRFTLNLNPNEVLGVLDRSRVLLWRETE